jgi:hypothetical protein
MDTKQSVLILGHQLQGMIAAVQLAKSGFDVRVVGLDGFDNAYHPFAKDYKVGPVTHVPFQIPKSLVDDLNLQDHGLVIEAPIDNRFVDLPFYDGLCTLLDSFETLDDNRPAYKEKAWRDTWGTFELGRILAGYDKDIQALFAQSTTLSLVELFENLPLNDDQKANMIAACIIGSRTDLNTKGSASALLPALSFFMHRDDTISVCGPLHPLLSCLKQAGMSLGVDYQDSIVKNIHAAGRDVTSVILQDDTEIEVDYYILDSDPVVFFKQYGDGLSLPPAFQNRVTPTQNLRECARVHMAVSAIPDDLQKHKIIAPTVDYIEKARTDFRVDGGSQLPFLSVINVTHDRPDFAPDGSHVLDILFHYCDPNLMDDEGAQDAFIQTTIQALDRAYPNFSDSIIETGFTKPNSQAGMPNFTGAMPLLQLFKIFFGHHAMGYDMPFDNMILAGYGSEACAHYHVQKGGMRVSTLLQSIQNNGT